MNLFPIRAALAAVTLWSVAAAAQSLPAGWAAVQVDGGVLYSPTDLPVGTVFSLFATVLDVGNATTAAAFATAKARAMPAEPLQCEGPKSEGEAMSEGCTGRGGGLEVRFLQLPVRGGRAHLLRIMVRGERNVIEPHKAGFSTVMSQQTRKWQAGADGQPAPAAPTQKELAEQTRREARAAIAQAVRTEPGRGLRTDQVEGVLVEWEQVYEITGLQYRESLYLLLKDGTAYRDPWVPPEDFDVAASRKLQPDRWLRWRRNGGSWEVRSGAKGGWRRLQANLGLPARRDERLARTFTHSSFANRGSLGGSASQQFMSFGADGRYEESSYHIQGTGAAQAGNGYTGGSSGGSSGKGSWGSSSGSQGPDAGGTGGTVTTGATSTRDNGAHFRGSYSLDGWTAHFKADSGRSSRQLFFFSESAREGINVGGTWYRAKTK
jgi:hypothetical protein